ncbi:GMC family oxidoreductase N-terminal domain-containing protein [Arsukibacterium sp.]|uniref:GMC family oxidoreductase N-terminal domain-containing protein n=1 Tax=Arsukibacterium sp. TaxID=1977258 RepID=UPI002FDA5368
MDIQYDYEAIVIGSGFGGAVTCCRLAKKWPGKVMLLERGKRYGMGEFPRSPHAMARNFWNLPPEQRPRPGQLQQEEQHGLFDIRKFKQLDAVVSAGYGGGSLIYANVFLVPPAHIFNDNWPGSTKLDALTPYYQVSKQVLGARPIPQSTEPRRQIIRTGLFQQFAKADGKPSQLLDINVFFGNDFSQPTAIGEQQRNRYGALQTSCVYCAECDVGCNTHSKNTVDLNYLFVAEQRYQAQIRTQVLAEKIVPLNAVGTEDTNANGEHGFRVYWKDLTQQHQLQSALARRVVVSAGTLGTNELLLRCRDLHHSLPALSPQLGQHFSGNGDFLSFVVGGKKPADPNYGPVITQGIDHHLYQDFKAEQAFMLEDASYPNFAAWYVEGIKPGSSKLAALLRTLRLSLNRFWQGGSNGQLGYAMSELLKNDLSYHTSVLLCMGLDKSDGVMQLDKRGNLQLDWPYKNSMPLYKAITDTGERFKDWCQAKAFVPMPNWLWPMRRNVTVHALGGCRLADNTEQGVTSADPASFGQVFGYKGLYVADGALLPAAVGANPVATICALSERVAEGITGIVPDANL